MGERLRYLWASSLLLLDVSVEAASVVTRVSGPSMQRFRPGQVISDDLEITLQAGDRLALLTNNGTRDYSGPKRFRPSDALVPVGLLKRVKAISDQSKGGVTKPAGVTDLDDKSVELAKVEAEARCFIQGICTPEMEKKFSISRIDGKTRSASSSSYGRARIAGRTFAISPVRAEALSMRREPIGETRPIQIGSIDFGTDEYLIQNLSIAFTRSNLLCDIGFESFNMFFVQPLSTRVYIGRGRQRAQFRLGQFTSLVAWPSDVERPSLRKEGLVRVVTFTGKTKIRVKHIAAGSQTVEELRSRLERAGCTEQASLLVEKKPSD